jgi:urease accessory protein
VSGSGSLELSYRRHGDATRAADRHHGPMRVLQALYPEGPGVCHHVLVHPPGGMVGGDRLDVSVQVGEQAHAVITTPGAARFYRSGSLSALQRVTLHLRPGARLEWLPLETIAYPGCRGENRLEMTLAPGAELMGWDLLALGLPASGLPFDTGRQCQHLHWPGVWLERGEIDAADEALCQGAAGLAGHRVLGTMWWASATPLDAMRREALLEAARAVLPGTLQPAGPAGAAALRAGATAPQPRLVLVRLLAQRVEPALALLQQVRAAWRACAWGLDAVPPRIWRT